MCLIGRNNVSYFRLLFVELNIGFLRFAYFNFIKEIDFCLSSGVVGGVWDFWCFIIVSWVVLREFGWV